MATTTVTDKPKFKHWCNRCVYLGHFYIDPTMEYDLYYCPGVGKPIATVLARFGDANEEYLSGLRGIHFSPVLQEALKRAEARIAAQTQPTGKEA